MRFSHCLFIKPRLSNFLCIFAMPFLNFFVVLFKLKSFRWQISVSTNSKIKNLKLSNEAEYRPKLCIWWCFLLLQLNGFQSSECVVVKKSQYMYKTKTWYHGKCLNDFTLFTRCDASKNSLVRFIEHHNSWIKIFREYFPWYINLCLTELSRSVWAWLSMVWENLDLGQDSPMQTSCSVKKSYE